MSKVKRQSEQAAENRRRVDAWATVCQDLRDYMAQPNPLTIEELARVQACITTLYKVWDGFKL